MSRGEDKLSRIAALLFSSIEGELDSDGFAELAELLENDRSAREDYYELVDLVTSLSGPEAMIKLQERCGAKAFDNELWCVLENIEENAPAAEVEINVDEPEPVAVVEVVRERPIGGSRPYLRYAAVVVVILAVTAGFLVSSLSPAARISGQVQANWQGSDVEMENGKELYPGNFVLSSGFAELAFNNGAVVVVEAPADFNVESEDTVYLHSGKLSALAEGAGASGFRVRTDKVDIVDLGTEFGVAADMVGNIKTCVYRGSVRVIAGEGGKAVSVLHESQAISVDSSGGLSEVYAASDRMFVRGLDDVVKWREYLGRNLVKNPGFEKNAAGGYLPDEAIDRQLKNVVLHDWVDNGPATVYSYDHPAEEGFPLAGENAVPEDCGKNFFIGVDNGDVYQDISLKELAALVDGQGVEYELSGWIGGFQGHVDSLTIIASFIDRSGVELGKAELEPVTANERNNESGFLFRKVSGTVPVGSEAIRLILRTKRLQGMADAYADNLELVLRVR